MIRQICEVLLTYVRRPLSGPAPFFMVLIALVGILQLVKLPLQYSAGGAWMAMYVPALIGVHLKQQALHVRERRLPSALYLHLAVGVGILLLVSLGIPLMRMALAHQWSVGLLGLVLAGTAVVFGAVISGNSVFFAAPVLLVWVLYSPATRQWIVDLCEGRNEQAGIALVACGLAGIWASMAYLRELTEEDRAYHQRLDVPAQNAYQRGTVQSTQLLNSRYRNGRWFNPPDPSEAAVARWKNLAHGSFWQRGRLWALSGTPPLGILAICFLFPLFSVAPLWLSGHPVDFLQSPGPLFWIIFPNMMIVTQWVQRRSQWPTESLRPVSRREFVLATGFALARSMALACLLIVVGWVAFVALLSPESLWTSGSFQMLAAMAVGQLLIFSTCAWIMRYRTPAVVGLGVFVGVLCVSIGAAALRLNRGVRVDPLGAAIWLVIAGAASAIVCWDAYRRWLNTELG
jgi:hypothetical protein